MSHRRAKRATCFLNEEAIVSESSAVLRQVRAHRLVAATAGRPPALAGCGGVGADGQRGDGRVAALLTLDRMDQLARHANDNCFEVSTHLLKGEE
jgi:hypothetical protein